MPGLAEIVGGPVYVFMLIFARLGAALMLIPGIGEIYVTPRIRLGLALLFSMALSAAGTAQPPALPDHPATLALMVAGEVVVGLFLGTLARTLLAALDVAGQVMAHHMGLANASLFNPQAATQGSLPGILLSLAGVALMMVGDVHHMMLAGIARSYEVMSAGEMPDTGDMAQMMTRLVGDIFIIGTQISAPFILVGLALFLGLGLLARLMPQLQVFFISLPAQVLLGLVVMAITVPAGLLFWLSRVETRSLAVLGGGG